MKLLPDLLKLTIPKEFNLQGAKLATISQVTAYKGIMERKPTPSRQTTLYNIQSTRTALTAFQGTQETDATIWNGLKNSVIRLRVRQFLYKALHGTQKVGEYWKHINGCETRQTCSSCESTESMEHILINCHEPPPRIIWSLARRTWPHAENLWPTPSLGIILGCGAITLPPPNNQPELPPRNPETLPNKGTRRLLQILISESAHLIWVLRCERVIRERQHHPEEIQARWLQAINARLTDDKITATRIKQCTTFTSLVTSTWEPILSKDRDIPTPSNWLLNSEVLVGTRLPNPPHIEVWAT